MLWHMDILSPAHPLIALLSNCFSLQVPLNAVSRREREREREEGGGGEVKKGAREKERQEMDEKIKTMESMKGGRRGEERDTKEEEKRG